jgi:hypothetical protein
MGTQAMKPEWRRSSHCSGGACLEVSDDAETVYVRDSKVADGPILEFSHRAWRDLIRAVRNDDFPAPQ